MTSGLLLIAALAVAGPPAEVSGHAGGAVAGAQAATGLFVEPFAALAVEGRYRPSPRGGFVDHLMIEGAAGGLLPLGGAALGEGAAIARVGLGFDTFSFSLGAHLRLSPTPHAPVQAFPSLVLGWKPGTWGLRLALFDRVVGPVARLAFEYGAFGVAVAPLWGAEAYGRVPLGETTSVELRAFWGALLESRSGGVTAGLVWTPAGGAR